MSLKKEFNQLKRYGELKKLMRKLKPEPTKEVIQQSDVTWDAIILSLNSIKN